MMGWDWSGFGEYVRAYQSNTEGLNTKGRLIQSDGGFQVSLMNFVDCMKNTLINVD